MTLSEWSDESLYILEQAEPFTRGYGPSEFDDRAQFLRYCTMQRNSATREGFPDVAQHIDRVIRSLYHV
jgi:hypothetical protein